MEQLMLTTEHKQLINMRIHSQLPEEQRRHTGHLWVSVFKEEL